jgi:hypothetical protein
MSSCSPMHHLSCWFCGFSNSSDCPKCMLCFSVTIPSAGERTVYQWDVISFGTRALPQHRQPGYTRPAGIATLMTCAERSFAICVGDKNNVVLFIRYPNGKVRLSILQAGQLDITRVGASAITVQHMMLFDRLVDSISRDQTVWKMGLL